MLYVNGQEYNQWRERRERMFSSSRERPCKECGAYFEGSTFCHLAWCNRYAEHGKEVDCWHPVGMIMPVCEVELGIFVKVGERYEFVPDKADCSCNAIL